MSRQVLSNNARHLHENIAQRIQEARRVADITQTEAANFIGVSHQQYKKYETGINRISAVTLQRLAILFNVGISWFFQEMPPRLTNDGTTQISPELHDVENLSRRSLSVLSASGSTENTHVSHAPRHAADPKHDVYVANDDTKHILLVDDEPDVLRLTASFLRKAGFAVSEVNRGDDALARLAAGERFDALVTDYALAGLSGLGLIDTMREIAPNLPVLIITGHSRDRDLIAGLPPKVQILAKPYSRNLFLGYIERLVGLPHKADRLKEDSEGLAPF